MSTSPAPTQDQIRAKETSYLRRLLSGTMQGYNASGYVALAVIGPVYWATNVWPMAAAVACLATGATVGGATATLDWLRDERAKILWDAPEAQAVLRQVKAQSTGALAERRGGVWVVSGPGLAAPAVMGAKEYERFRKDLTARGESLDEVRIEPGAVTVSRTVAGRLDAGGRVLPAHERYDLSDETKAAAGWFAMGRRVAREAIIARVQGRAEDETEAPRPFLG